MAVKSLSHMTLLACPPAEGWSRRLPGAQHFAFEVHLEVTDIVFGNLERCTTESPSHRHRLRPSARATLAQDGAHDAHRSGHRPQATGRVRRAGRCGSRACWRPREPVLGVPRGGGAGGAAARSHLHPRRTSQSRRLHLRTASRSLRGVGRELAGQVVARRDLPLHASQNIPNACLENTPPAAVASRRQDLCIRRSVCGAGTKGLPSTQHTGER